IRDRNLSLPKNVLVGKLNEDGFDIASETVDSWQRIIMGAKMIVWNGPVGKIDNGQRSSFWLMAHYQL
ncbi:MAG: phosphoglycerate kinase, partial [bacterium]|nr:phosphoglycerate kinase [bacterium]